MISVLLATCNRPERIRCCLESILANSYPNFEVLIADQSDGDKTKKIVNRFTSQNIKYFKLKSKGKSRALNFLVKKARGSILSFTDDDCLVDKDWLKKINLFFSTEKRAAGVFGKVLPYKPQEHKRRMCPATFKKNRAGSYNSPDLVHYLDLGLGNNMSFKKSVVNEVGMFKDWLGVGSISLAGGIESELIYRILKQKYFLHYRPEIIVEHNRWLTFPQERLLQGKYTSGLMAFYFYYFLKKDNLMKKFMAARIKERIYKRLTHFIKKLVQKEFKYLYFNKLEPVFLTWEIFCFFRGLLIGGYIYFSEKRTT